MSRRAVNIATISEEDVLGEEIGVDGMVEMVPCRLSEERDDFDVQAECVRKRENGESDPVKRISASRDLQRPNSLVENEDDDGAEVSSSILTAISSLEGTAPRVATPSPSRRHVPGSLRSGSPARSSSLSSLHSISSSSSSSSGGLKRNTSWRGGRGSNSTLNLSGKFVTELTLYDPHNGPVKSSCISLGLFIATDQAMGDHSVYKMSPVSPLSALKIQQQDRLLKVNDISVMGWSHSCLVEVFRNLTLAPPGGKVSKDGVFEMPLSMEFRKSGKVVRSVEESPSSRRVAATIRIRNHRAGVLSVHDSIVRVRHNISYEASIRLKGNPNDGGGPLFLKTTASTNIVTLSVGENSSSDDAVRFRLHQFDVSPPRSDSGDIAVIEIPEGEGYLYTDSPNTVAVMQGLTTQPSTLLQTDVRFFQLVKVPGSSAVRIKNVHTGQYLSASQEKVELVTNDDSASLPESTLFEVEAKGR